MDDDVDLYTLKDFFKRYSVDEDTYYCLEDGEVDSTTWALETNGGFYHWAESLRLFDVNATIEDVISSPPIDEIVISEG